MLWDQPPPQALRFSHGRGERETRVTGDGLQGTMGRVQTTGHFHRERDVWVRGSAGIESRWCKREFFSWKIKETHFENICWAEIKPLSQGTSKFYVSVSERKRAVLACTQTLFYFSFRSFRKHRRAREKGNLFSSSPTPTPLVLAVNNSPAVFIFYHARSTNFEEKIEGQWTS